MTQDEREELQSIADLLQCAAGQAAIFAGQACAHDYKRFQQLEQGLRNRQADVERMLEADNAHL